MSVISYTLHKCTKCMRCLKICPTEAITIVNERVKIATNKCINCGLCIKNCKSSGLSAKGSTLVDKGNYKKSICLVPTAIYADCANIKEVRRLNAAISKLGFDEVVYLSEYEGSVYAQVNEVLEQANHLMISSFCPVINKLIETNYPMLLDQMIDFEYPAELAARCIKQQQGEDIGIFLLCECPAKLALAKYPYGNVNSMIDHALSIRDLFPLINSLRNQDELPASLCEEGIKLVATGLGQRIDRQILSINGLDKIKQALELAEFDLLKDVAYLSCSACYNGCIGGSFLWGNPFNGRINMNELTKSENVPYKRFTLDQLKRQEMIGSSGDNSNLFDRLTKFKQINEVYSHLPGFDCGACGFPSCRSMAEAIVENERTLKDCRILGKGEKNEGS